MNAVFGRSMMRCLLLLAVLSWGGSHAEAEEAKQVLFIGNSYTYQNDLPGHVAGLSDEAAMRLQGTAWKVVQEQAAPQDAECNREAALPAALNWMDEKQQDDGGWALDGTMRKDELRPATSTEATGLALLAYLGAGQTHKEGVHKKQVDAGLAFLIKQMKVKERRGDLRGSRGDMISHAIAANAICEAYAMTHDKELLAPAQFAVNYIIGQQDEKSGGWKADSMGRPSVAATGWQLQALKSAHMAYLSVPGDTVVSATKFLDDVQLDAGRAYPGGDGRREHQATAIGLYSRRMLGTKRSDPAMVGGLAAVGRDGPQQHDVIANYFAHRLHHSVLGESWQSWNSAIRKQLVDSQCRDGEQVGSWYDAKDASKARGGRLLQTAIDAMVLETYVRGPDLIRGQNEENEFPL